MYKIRDNEVRDEICLIIKKNNKWSYFLANNHNYSEPYFIPYIEHFLLENRGFLLISENIIINLKFVDDYAFSDSENWIMISGEKHIVSEENINKVQWVVSGENEHALIPFQILMDCRNSETSVEEINYDKVKYIIREDVESTIYFDDLSIKSLNDTLKNFENRSKNYPFFVRINRQTIINIKFLNFLDIGLERRNRVIKIDNQNFRVSRRTQSKFTETTLFWLTTIEKSLAKVR